MADAEPLSIHGLTGIVAILLMFIHAAWATNEALRRCPMQEPGVEGQRK
jgi:hypothetical protein